ncbi:MAG: branched-chain amino acid transporter AzlD [Tissierellia bacterium]|nr:branched-chain amino acid transporter AzlD [Tissierellia bacterium]
MTTTQKIITIALMALTSAVLRFLPFVLFSSEEKTPEIISYLGKILPASIFGFLVIYSVKHVELFKGYSSLPEAIAIAATALIHYYKKNTFLSIAVGTVLYMVLVQFVFI